MNKKTVFEKAVYDSAFRVLVSKNALEKRIQQLGQQLTRDYRDKEPIIVGVLNGCFIFIADLVRAIELDLEIDFLKISSYGDAQVSSGQVTMLKDLQADIRGRHVLVVEDIVDTGLSLKFLQEKLSALKPASLKFVTLLYKKQKAKIHFEIDYIGFEIPDEFVIGYGLDHKQILRNLPAVYIMD
ncbi:hypoxanthine phosphoribosyltransferase [candidate division KSB1 bacterium]|nr:hypoxanthine phosphoribosyltransferase [candidate division KSB1 bacterium]RQW05119.1 MAG: hypoxanthine phosphoribosyltransferase [candidate division KSB1 bacterium]